MTYLFRCTDDWTPERIEEVYEQCEIIGRDELRLDWYPNFFEIIDFQNQMDMMSSVAMPMMYNHWSFGKTFLQNQALYKKGHIGLSLETVINTNPCVNYLMDENSMTAQALVIAHAAIGHNSFFKNNYLFKQWTQADSILDYLNFAKKYIEKCEDKYGVSEVEAVLDAAHSLQLFGVDRYIKPRLRSAAQEEIRQKERDEHYEKNINELWSLIPQKKKAKVRDIHADKFLPQGNEENLLYFLEKNSPILQTWQREILRIVRKIATYFAPQRMTKIANEGWATTCHYYIMNRFYDKGFVDDGSMMEFLDLHSSVICQRDYNQKGFSGFNPYHLGFSIFSDIKRMSETPTDEDKEWFPDLAGRDWVENWHYAYQNFRDDSFVQQFLSPKVMRDMKLFAYQDDADEEEYLITSIHNERGYRDLRRAFADQISIDSRVPDIQVTRVDFETRMCFLTHFADNEVLLDGDEAFKTLAHFRSLWGFELNLQSRDRKTNDLLADYDV